MSVLPNDRQYLPNNLPVGGCTCHCHYTPGVVHFMACCGRGGIKEATDALKALTNSGAPVPGDGRPAQAWIDRAAQIESAARALLEGVDDLFKRADRGSGRLYAANRSVLEDRCDQLALAVNTPEPPLAHAAPAPSDGATGPVPAISAELLGEVMQDAWGEICDDTGCHPLDISRHKRSTWYSPRHWTDLIALRLNERLAKPEAGVPAGMVPWSGGDSAPEDWDGGPVLLRDGSMWFRRPAWRHVGQRLAPGGSADRDIIAYTPKQATPTDEAVLAERAQIVWRQDAAPQDGSTIYGHSWRPYRWKAYSPKSEQFRHGIKGRWQAMNEFGGWDNAEAPDEWATSEQIETRRARPAPGSGREAGRG